MRSAARSSYDALLRPLAALALRFWIRRSTAACHGPSEHRRREAGRRRVEVEPRDVDAVYTWVDMSDPVWRSRQQARLLELGAEAGDSGDELYLDREELRYSLRSLHLYAPWIRHVWLLTDRQVPSWLEASHPRLSVIDHRSVFPDPSVLPVFNSHAIESCLHRIDGLSRRFLYLNDDFFLGRAVAPSDFLTSDDRLRARVRDSRGARSPAAGELPFMWANRRAVELVEARYGTTDFGPMLDHVPHLLDRDLMREIEEIWPDVATTRGSVFRSRQDVAPVMLALLLAVAKGDAATEQLGPRESLHVATGRLDVGLRLLWLWAMRPRFYCLNATKDDDLDPVVQQQVLHAFLRTVLPEPSHFERPG